MTILADLRQMCIILCICWSAGIVPCPPLCLSRLYLSFQWGRDTTLLFLEHARRTPSCMGARDWANSYPYRLFVRPFQRSPNESWSWQQSNGIWRRKRQDKHHNHRFLHCFIVSGDPSTVSRIPAYTPSRIQAQRCKYRAN